MTSTNEVEEFMQGPLVAWLQSCLDDAEKLQDYGDLIDGCLIQQVLLLIDPEPVYGTITPNLRNIWVRVKNICNIVRNIKVLYEEELCQLVVCLPDCVRLGKDPVSKEGLEDMKLLLLLLLGCAVQCPNKHTFIERIKSLPLECQHTLVHCIQQVTESQEIVLTSENCDKLTTELLLSHVRRLVKERDHYFQMWLSLLDEKKQSSNTDVSAAGISNAVESQNQHLAVEIADWKAKLRKLRQELEEKAEALIEAKDEIERHSSVVSKLKSEMQQLKQEARAGKAYRDEVDALREKAERCDRLEAEVGRYKEKLGDLEYFKSRVEELRQDNKVLEETREMLEEQLTKARKKAENSSHLEADIVRLKQTVDELTLERDAHQEKVHELIEETTRLRLYSKSQSANNSLTSVGSESNALSCAIEGSSDSSLSEQLNTTAQARIRKLEFENKKLQSTVDSIQEMASQQSNEKILSLEKDKKKLSLTVKDLENYKKCATEQISQLGILLEDTRNSLKTLQENNELLRQQIVAKEEEIGNMIKEKGELENKINDLLFENDSLRKNNKENSRTEDQNSKQLTALEKEVCSLKEALEENAKSMDRLSSEKDKLQTEKCGLEEELCNTVTQLGRLNELENEVSNLRSQHEMDIATLTALENNLVAEKVKAHHLQTNLDNFGLINDRIADPEKVLDKIASIPEIMKAVKERLIEDEKNASETSPLSNAKLQVNLTTLQSQISSLSSQHTALQLANSQLVAEKEEVLKELNGVRTSHQGLLADQKALQSLHEQLNCEYETIIKEREALKITVRDLRVEKRKVFEQCSQLKFASKKLEEEKENFAKQSRTLVNLREEHSKLKEDFRNLFTASEKIKLEYRSLQEKYNSVHSEAVRLKHMVTDLQGKLTASCERNAGLEVEIASLNNQHEMLAQVKQNLEEDRRTMMEHVTKLFSQYHELLTHSLEDKEQYHMEEKIFAEKLNNLCRQKEKLEEKLIQQYGKMDSCSYKKKGIGARIVGRVKKAGSDLIHKRRSFHEELSDRRNSDSDTSIDDQPSRIVDVDDALSCLSVPGTRRTVYLSGNDNVDADNISTTSTNEPDEPSKASSLDPPIASTPKQEAHRLQPPLLIYNRISANLGTSQEVPEPSSVPSHHSTSSSSVSKENSAASNPIWYEYGCV